MCGITGFFASRDLPIDEQTLWAMTNSIAHRGPDDAGVWLHKNVGLGHRRLSIIDLSEGGHQPMISSDGFAVVVFNGEIYNYRELRDELLGEGVVFRSCSDTEVIVEGFRHWGVGVLTRLNGMFAIAIMDLQNKRLLLARDRFGVKPLYYSMTDSGLVFGSEIKALIASNRISKEIDECALAEYLHYSSPLGDKSFFKSVNALGPGELLWFDGGSHIIKSFSSVIPDVSCSDGFEVATSTVRELLEASVSRQMVADVPIGVFLSGGIDSSVIATIASRHSSDRLQTFSADFAFAEDESELAAAKFVAEKIGAKHKELRIEPSDLIGSLEALVSAHDQPFGDAANIPIFLMSRALEGRVKVVLQGDGGDELFAGYPRYARLANRRLLQLAAVGMVPFHSFIPKASRMYRALRSLNALTFSSSDIRMALLMSQELFGTDPVALIGSDYRNRLLNIDPFTRYREMHQRFAHLDPVQEMLYTDLSVILPDVYFSKVDRASMQHGVEVRVPMMDNELVEYVAALPAKVKLKDGELKSLLKTAFRGMVPDQILDARKKGFGVPVSTWLRGPLASYMKDLFSDPVICRSGLFDEMELFRRMNEHVAGSADYGQSLYKMLNLAIWYRAHFG